MTTIPFGPDATMALRSPQRLFFLWPERDGGCQVTTEVGPPRAPALAGLWEMALTRLRLSGHHKSGRCLWREFRGSGRQLLYDATSRP